MMTSTSAIDAREDFERKTTLFAALWAFAMFNYLYADVIGLMDPVLLRQYLSGSVAGLQLTPAFLFAAGVLMEVPIAMTLLSKVLPRRANRWANLAAGSLKTAVVLSTLFLGKPTAYYVFFSILEIACTSTIVVLAWRWTGSAPVGSPMAGAARLDRA